MTSPATVSPAPPTPARMAPGLTLCGVGVAVALAVNHWLPTVSPLLVAIVLGAVLANAVALPARVQPGLAVAAKRLLRAGIVLLGLQVMLRDILGLGAAMIAVVVAVVTLGILGTLVVGRLLGVGPGLRLLVACGFSICGAAAVAAVDGVVDAEEEDVATAVALVVLFGTMMIPVVPLLVSAMGLGAHAGGLWAGGSVHEVAQVVAAGGAIGGGALTVAVIVKLARVLMLAPVMAVISWRRRRALQSEGSGGTLPPLVPLFVVGFLVMVLARSFLPLPEPVLGAGRLVQTVLLTAAMFALGCGVHRSILRRVGLAPFALATVSTTIVAVVALVGVTLAG
ncbi:YeiH family protein [Arsenicicoccus sp. oral taxon 190]|uniref:YeiH family protein n=1 Tax=Arsenicicoccus sp. oral taxon 190 TaxID=1658671 RepID=UPI00067A0CBA|nr:putative sulfate exporter family transporter [Arsenicicoccus sp. oral taxon 190]AKT52888.1 membrane protein [Arsenicicoccus sp. oral taxon 190]